MPFLLSQVDADGNEIGGIRLPEQEVPLGTMTGWQFRSERIGAPHTLMVNSRRATSRSRRRAPNGQRPAIHGCRSRSATPSRADYLAKVEQVAHRLARERYVLPARRAGNGRGRGQALGLADGRAADRSASLTGHLAARPQPTIGPTIFAGSALALGRNFCERSLATSVT